MDASLKKWNETLTVKSSWKQTELGSDAPWCSVCLPRAVTRNRRNASSLIQLHGSDMDKLPKECWTSKRCFSAVQFHRCSFEYEDHALHIFPPAMASAWPSLYSAMLRRCKVGVRRECFTFFHKISHFVMGPSKYRGGHVAPNRIHGYAWLQ